MNVTPIWPVFAITGLVECPVRGVMAECRTSFENCLAFLRIVMFNIGCFDFVRFRFQLPRFDTAGQPANL
jgi:hypothetical protein